MRILTLGDVTSPGAVEYLSKNLWKYREREKIDLVIVNAENAAFITGTSEELAKKLLMSGADCLTGGNHTMRNRSVYTFLDECREIIRPVNFGDSAPGRGYTTVDALGYRILVINALGCALIDPVLNSPFEYIERVLRETEGDYDFSILDFHAEATGEKLAVAAYFDGRINIVFGTHTHVQTADERILKGGTGYITDVGMCGESGGILGITSESVIESLRTHMPPRFKPAVGEVVAEGAIFTLDTSRGIVTDVKRVKF